MVKVVSWLDRQTAGVPEQKRREIDSEVGDRNVCQLKAHLLVIKKKSNKGAHDG